MFQVNSRMATLRFDGGRSDLVEPPLSTEDASTVEAPATIDEAVAEAPDEASFAAVECVDEFEAQMHAEAIASADYVAEEPPQWGLAPPAPLAPYNGPPSATLENLSTAGEGAALTLEAPPLVVPPERWSEIILSRIDAVGRSLAGPFASAVVHCVVLLLFSQLIIGTPSTEPERLHEITSALDPLQEEVYNPELSMQEVSDTPREHLLSSLSMSAAPIQNDVAELISIDKPAPITAASFNPSADIPFDVPFVGVMEDPNIAQEGTVGEEVAHVRGAVDRLTFEIADRLKKHDLLVVWLMDSTLSLVEDRQEVAGRLERILSELDQTAEAQGSRHSLKNAVVGWGSQAKELVGPTEDDAKIVDAIRSVPTDESGVENIFTTIVGTIERYRFLRTREQRRIMLVVWTDESGDDYSRLEEAVSVCKKLSVPVFTVGPSAMFGVELGTHAYKLPETGQTYLLPVNRGPECVRQERLRVPYWFKGPQLDTIHSGLSPFALTRLARETGGDYLIKDNAADKSPFRLETMRRYMPEYEPPAEYMRRVTASPLRSAILRAVDLTYQRKLKETPQLSFAPTGDNFQQQLREAQETVAYNSQILDEALAAFGPKGLETQYRAETSPRWRAWYDLTFGRLLAMRVRCNEYNWACAEMKGKGSDFVDKKSNRWQFKPSPKLNFGSASEKQAAEATRLLKRSVAENPDTPWELLAQRELDNTLGFAVDEGYVAPPPPPPPAPPRVNPPPPPQRPRPAQPPQPLARPVEPKLPRL